MCRSCSKRWGQSGRCIRPTIGTQVTGTLEEAHFSEGQKVKRGQILTQIDPRTFQAALDQAIATRDRDQAHLDNAKANLGRNKPLLKRGFATAQQVDTQTAQVTQLQNTGRRRHRRGADRAELHHDHRVV
jgi:multidrug efflux pump subunit AcrA (membrane-fusion protein)